MALLLKAEKNQHLSMTEEQGINLDSVTRLRMATIGAKRQIRRIWRCRSTILTLYNIFLCFNSKKHVLTVFHMTVTLRIMSNSRRFCLVINAHLPIDQAGGSYCSNCGKLEKWRQSPSK
jgi:hypothetical protein